MLLSKHLRCVDNNGDGNTVSLDNCYRQNWKYRRHYRILPATPAYVSKLLKTLTS